MKKFLKISLVFVLIILSGAMLIGCGKKPIQSITLSAPSDTYYVGDEFDISVSLTPDKASKDDLVWEVNNRLIGSVNDGHVKTIGKGRLVITAYYKKNSNIRDEIAINVMEKTDGLNLQDTTVVYNGKAQTPQYTSPVGVEVLFQYAPVGSSIFVDGLPINAGSYRVRGYVNGNNSLVDICNLVIQKKDLKVEVGDATINYSDNFDNVVAVNVEGLVSGENFNFSTKLQNSIPPSQLVVGTYPIVYKITNNNGEEIELANYNIIATNGTLTVIPKNVTVVPNGGFQVTYGKIPNLTYNVKDENGTNIDDIYLSQINGYLDYVSQDGTSNKNDVGVKNITAGTLSSTNFNIQFDNTQTFTINARTLTLYPQGKTVLPGTVITDFEYTASGLLAGDRIENPFMLNADNQIVQNNDIIIYNSNDRVVTGNYNISVQPGVSITEGINVNININPIRLDYNGTDYENAEITILTSNSINNNTAISYINNDGQTVLVNNKDIKTNNNYYEISFTIITGAKITIQLGFKENSFEKTEDSTTIYATRKFAIANGNENYIFNINKDAGIEIRKIQSVISVQNGDMSITYGDIPDPQLNITNKNEGTAWELQAEVEYYNKNGEKITLDTSTPVGTYEIRPVITSTDYSMYNVDINEANLFITAAPIDIVLNDENFQKEYGKDDPQFTYTINGLKNTEDYATVVAGQLVREAGENVGEYDINQGSLHTITKNYYIRSYSDGGNKFDITPAPLAITLINSSKIYGEDDPQLLYTVSGLKFSDTASAVITGQPIRDEGENVATYDITGDNLSIVYGNNNYTLNSIANATFTINARPLTINIITKDILGESEAISDNVEYSVSQNGLVNNDQITTITFSFEESNNLQVKTVVCTIGNGETDATNNYNVQLGANKTAFNLIETQAIINIDNIIIDYNQDGYTLNPTYQLVTNVDGLTVKTIEYQYEDINEEPITTPTDAGTYYINAVVTLSDENVSYTVNKGTLIINKINAPTTPEVTTIEYNEWLKEKTLANVSITNPINWSITWNDKTQTLQQGRHQYLAICTPTDTNNDPNPNYNSVNIWITVIAREEIDAGSIQATLQWDNRLYNGQTYTQNQFTELKIGDKDYLQYLNVSYSYEYNGEKITNGFTNSGTYTTVGTISIKSTYNDLFVITGTPTTIRKEFSIDKATATLVNTIPANGYKYTGEPIVVWGSENDLYIKENISINTTITIYNNEKNELGVIGQKGYSWPSMYGTYYITILLESDNYKLNIDLDNAIEYTINKQTLTITYNNLKDQYTYSNTLSLTKDNIGVTIEENNDIDTQTTFYNIIESVPEDIDTSSKKQLDEDGNVFIYKKIGGASNVYSYLSIKNVDESLSYYQICDNQTISNAGEYAVVTLASDQNYEGKAHKTFVINKASIGSIRLQSDYITVSRTTTNDELWQKLVNNILTTSIKSQPLYFVINNGNENYFIRNNDGNIQVADNNGQIVTNFLNNIKPKTNGNNYTITLAIDSSQNYNALNHNFNFNTIKEDVSFEVIYHKENYFNGKYIVPHTIILSGGYFGSSHNISVDTSKLIVNEKAKTLKYTYMLEDIKETITITFKSTLKGIATLPRNASTNLYTTTTTLSFGDNTYFNLDNTEVTSQYTILRATYTVSKNSDYTGQFVYNGQQININELRPLLVTNDSNAVIDFDYNTITNYFNVNVEYRKQNETTTTTIAPTNVGKYYIEFTFSVKSGEATNVKIESNISEVELTIAKYQLLASDLVITGNNVKYDADSEEVNVVYNANVELDIVKNPTSNAPINNDDAFVVTYNNETQLPTAVGSYNIKVNVQNNSNISELSLVLNITANDISDTAKIVANKTYNYGNPIIYNADDLSTNKLLTNEDIILTYYESDGTQIENITDAGTYSIQVVGKGNFTGSFRVENVIVDKLDISTIDITREDVILTNRYNNNLLSNIDVASVKNCKVQTQHKNISIKGNYIFVKEADKYVKASTEGELSIASEQLNGISNINNNLINYGIETYELKCYFMADDPNFIGIKKDLTFTYIVDPAPTEEKTIDYTSNISINEIIDSNNIKFNSISSSSNEFVINEGATNLTVVFENDFNIYIINNTVYLALTPNYDTESQTYSVVFDQEYTYREGDSTTGTTNNGYLFAWKTEDEQIKFVVSKELTTSDKTFALYGGRYRENENYEYGDVILNITFVAKNIDGTFIVNPQFTVDDQDYSLSNKSLNVESADYLTFRPENFISIITNATMTSPTIVFDGTQGQYTLNSGKNLNNILNTNRETLPLPAGDYDATLTVTLPNTIWYDQSQSVDFTLQATFNKIDLRWNPQSLQNISSTTNVPTFTYDEAIGNTYYVTYYLEQKNDGAESTQTSKKLFTITYNSGSAVSEKFYNGYTFDSIPGGLYSYSITDSAGTDKLDSKYNNNIGYFALYKPDMFNQDSSVVYGELLSVSDIMKDNSPLSLFAYEVNNVNLNDKIDINFFNNYSSRLEIEKETDNIVTAFYLPIEVVTTFDNYVFEGTANIKVNLIQGYKIVPIEDTTSKVYDGEALTVKVNIYTRKLACNIDQIIEGDSVIDEKIEYLEQLDIVMNEDGTAPIEVTQKTSSSNVGEYNLTFTYEDYTQQVVGEILKATPKFIINDNSLSQVYDTEQKNIIVSVYGVNDIDLSTITIYYKLNTQTDDQYSTTAPTDAGEYDVKIVHNSQNHYGEYYTVLTVNKAMATVTVEDTTFEYNEKNQIPTITVKGLNDSTLTLGSDYQVVYNDGKTSINAGSYTAVLNMSEDSNYTYQANYTINYAIMPKQVSDLTLDTTEYTYNGNEQIPNVMNDGVTLIDDDNITIQKPSNSINAGSYSITITGQNNYVGKAVLNYVIRPSKLDITVDSTQTFVYDGSIQRPTYIVQDHNGIDVSAKYYTVTQSDSIEVGPYAIIIKSSNPNYIGKRVIEYVIKPYQAQIEVSGLNKVYGKDGEPSITVKGVGGEILTPADYSITYNDGATVPTDAGEYVVKVVMTNNNYVGTFVGNYTIQKDKANISITNLEQDYTGSAINPTITVTDSKDEQLDESNYTVTYKENGEAIDKNDIINAGKYTVEVELSNPNYYGYAIATFVINRLIANIDITTENFVYDGTVHDLEYQVTYNGEQVTEQRNTVETIKNVKTNQETELKNARVYEISIFVLTNNYQAQVTKYIEIYKKEATIKVTNLEVEYNGTQQSPTIRIYDGDSLLGDISYSTTYNDNGESVSPTAVGVYDIVITIDNDNYYGTYSGKFVISKATPTITWNTNTEFTYGSVSVSEATIDVNGASVTYYVDGQEKTIEEINDLSAGTYVITAQFDGNENYNAVSISNTIVIKKQDISDQITIEDLTQQYDGTAKKPTINILNDLDYIVTYNGVLTLPNAVGTYEVIVRVNTDNYIGLKVAVFKIVSQENELPWDTNTVFEYGNVTITGLAGASYTINNDPGDLSSIVDAGDYTVVATVGDKSVIKTITVIPQKKDITISYSEETNDFSAVFDGTDITVKLKYYNGKTELTQEQINKKEWGEVLTIIAEVEYGTGNYYGYAQSTFTTATSIIEKVTVDNLSGVSSIIENDYTSTGNTINFDSNYSVEIVGESAGIEILENTINITKAGRYLVKYSSVDNNNAYKYQYIVINKINPTFEWNVSQYEYDKGASVSLNGATTDGGTISYQVNDNNTFDNIDELNTYINNNPADSYKITAILNGGDNYHSKSITYYITFKSILASATITYNTFEVGETIDLGLIVTPTNESYTTTYYDFDNEAITSITNLPAGKYYAIVEFTGNYVGSYRFDFVVNKKITSINWNSQQFVYNGQDHSQAINKNASVVGVSDSQIEYIINNEDNWIGVGSYTATAKFAGNDEYEACEITLTFTVIPAEVKYVIDSQTSIFDNQSKTPTIQVIGINNDPLSKDTDYTIEYYKDSVVPEIKDAGEYEIRITIINPNYCGSQSFSYIVQKAQATITITGLNADYNGQSQSPTISIIGIAGDTLNYNVTYNELTTNELTTEPLNAGSYEVKVIVDDENYYGEKQAIFVINKIEAAINVNQSDLEKIYNGSTQKPNISVVGYDGEALQSNEYSIVYKKNNKDVDNPKDAGTYQIYVEVNESSTNYFGSAQFEYTIHRAKANITVSNYVTTYNNQSQEPTIAVTGVNGNLSESSDYTVVYKNGEDEVTSMIDAGTYSVVVNVTNPNYYGEESFDFVIQQAQAHFSVTNLLQTYNGENQIPTINVTGIDNDTVNYNVTYNEETTLPQNVGEYAVAITINNSNYYGYYEGTFVIQKAKVSINVSDNDTFEYDGNAHKLEFSMTGGTLSASDYTVKYYNSSGNEVENINNITNVGVYKAVVEITNTNYTGEYIHYMNITPKNIANITLNVDGSELSNNDSLALAYNGSEYAFSYNNKGEQQISYEYQYAELGSATYTTPSKMTIQQAGRYNIILTGTGNYKGQIRFFIVVNKQDNPYSISKTTYVYNGTDYMTTIKNSITSTNGAGMGNIVIYNYYNLSSPVDEVINAGTYLVRVSDNNSVPYEFVVSVAKKYIVGLKQTDNTQLSTNTGTFTVNYGTSDARDYTYKEQGNTFKHNFNVFSSEGHPHNISILINVTKISNNNFTFSVVYQYEGKIITGIYPNADIDGEDISICINKDGDLELGEKEDAYINCKLVFKYEEGSITSVADTKNFSAYMLSLTNIGLLTIDESNVRSVRTTGNMFAYEFTLNDKEGNTYNVNMSVKVTKNEIGKYNFTVQYQHNGEIVITEYTNANIEGQNIEIKINKDKTTDTDEETITYELNFKYKENVKSLLSEESLSVDVQNKRLMYFRGDVLSHQTASLYQLQKNEGDKLTFKHAVLTDENGEVYDNPKLLNSQTIIVTYSTNKIIIEGDNFIIEL